MPFYDYSCDNCGHKFEVLQNIHDKPKKKCPAWCKQKLLKVFAPPSLVFKGTGFYCTDYRQPQLPKELE